MLEDDRPSHPLTGVHELTVRGRLETADLAAAVEAARVRHPLLCRVIDPAGKRSAWVKPAALSGPAGDDRPRTRRPPAVPPGRAVAGHHPRTRPAHLGAGRTAGVTDGAPVARLTVAIHHCCADALGGLTFLFDLFAHLSAARGGPPVPPPPDTSRLRRRGGFYDREGRVPGLPPGRAGLLGHLAVGLRRLSKKPSIPLAASDANAGLFEGHPGRRPALPAAAGCTFSPGETTRPPRGGEGAGGARLNDLVLRDLFLSPEGPQRPVRHDGRGPERPAGVFAGERPGEPAGRRRPAGAGRGGADGRQQDRHGPRHPPAGLGGGPGGAARFAAFRNVLGPPGGARPAVRGGGEAGARRRRPDTGPVRRRGLLRHGGAVEPRRPLPGDPAGPAGRRRPPDPPPPPTRPTG